MGNYVISYLDCEGEEQVMEVPAYSKAQAVFFAEQDSGVYQIVDVECASAKLMCH